MKPADFTTNYRQATLWFEDFEPTVRQVMALALDQWATLFDGEPSMLPTGVDFPVDLPRVTLVSADRQWRFEVARRRANLVWDMPVLSDVVVSVDAFSDVVARVFKPFLALVAGGVRVSRLAYVVRRLLVTERPGAQLVEFFCRPELIVGPLNRPGEFQLHAHKVYRPGVLPEVNSWIRWRTAVTTQNDRPCITIENDLNTRAEAMAATRFSDGDIESFFDSAPLEAETVVEFYLTARGA